jgi:hypothetical protein
MLGRGPKYSSGATRHVSSPTSIPRGGGSSFRPGHTATSWETRPLGPASARGCSAGAPMSASRTTGAASRADPCRRGHTPSGGVSSPRPPGRQPGWRRRLGSSRRRATFTRTRANSAPGSVLRQGIGRSFLGADLGTTRPAPQSASPDVVPVGGSTQVRGLVVSMLDAITVGRAVLGDILTER